MNWGHIFQTEKGRAMVWSPGFAKLTELETLLTHHKDDTEAGDGGNAKTPDAPSLPESVLKDLGLTSAADLTPDLLAHMLAACAFTKELILKQRELEKQDMDRFKHYRRFLSEQRQNIELFTQRVQEQTAQFQALQARERKAVPR